MKNNMRLVTKGMSGLNLLSGEKQAVSCKGYSGMWFVVLLLLVLMAGCGGSDSSGGHSKPVVSSTAPKDLAEGVALDANITATFTNVMDPSSINTTTFTVTGPDSTPVEGEVSLSAIGLTAIFTPIGNFAPETTFTATLTTEVRDLNFKTLPANVSWSFKTGTTLSPTVLNMSPANSATDVPVGTTVSAEFSVAMDPLTINTTTFTMAAGPGLQPVAGTVIYDETSRVATFTPTGLLVPGTQYLVTVTTGVKDISGNPMKASQVWIFLTAL
jgi:hypothetical protein